MQRSPLANASLQGSRCSPSRRIAQYGAFVGRRQLKRRLWNPNGEQKVSSRSPFSFIASLPCRRWPFFSGAAESVCATTRCARTGRPTTSRRSAREIQAKTVRPRHAVAGQWRRRDNPSAGSRQHRCPRQQPDGQAGEEQHTNTRSQRRRQPQQLRRLHHRLQIQHFDDPIKNQSRAGTALRVRPAHASCWTTVSQQWWCSIRKLELAWLSLLG